MHVQHAQSRIETMKGVIATQLNNEREIYIYLPPGYEDESASRYPVVYMNVGQHVFEPSKPSGEAWFMHRVVDQLIAEHKVEKMIVVGIEHRYQDGTMEFFHDRFSFPQTCTGAQYEHFLVHELKPLIDSTYRTRPEAEHTALVGASAAGMSAYTVGMRNPHVFGNLGMFSPFFIWLNPENLQETVQYELYPPNPRQKLWLDIGGAEGFFMPDHVRRVALELLEAGAVHGDNLHFYLEPEGAHSEIDWGRRVRHALLHFFGQKGNALKVQLTGPERIGLQDWKPCLNPIITSDTGFTFSDLAGSYSVADPELLEVRAGGLLFPKQPGSTTVTYTGYGMSASCIIEICEQLPALVEVEVTVRVPDFTPADEPVHTSFRLSRVGKCLYRGTYQLPRGLVLDFLISRGYGKDECGPAHERLDSRRLTADCDKSLSYEVANWFDYPPLVEGGAT